jgi:hypothetical protein
MPVAHYPRYRLPPAIISHPVWLYFTLSFRDVEDLLAQRDITVSYESIRHWCEIFGAAYARRLRRWAGPVGDTWHLDELLVTIRGQRQYLWRAVDQRWRGHRYRAPAPPASRSTTSVATHSSLDDIGFAPAISDFCARARSLRGTPWQRPDDYGVEIIPNVAVVDVNLTVPVRDVGAVQL